MAKIAKKLTLKEHAISVYFINKRLLQQQWKEYLIIAVAPFIGLLMLYFYLNSLLYILVK